MGFPDLSRDRCHRAPFRTKGTSRASGWIDPVIDQIFAMSGRATVVVDMRLILRLEIPDRAEHRVSGGPAQLAQAGLVDGMGNGFQEFNVSGLAGAIADTGQDAVHGMQSFPAGSAFPAGFIHQKTDEVPSDIDHAGPVIHDDHAAGTHHGANLGQGIEIDGHIEFIGRDTPSGGAAGLYRLESAIIRDAAADIVDDLPECHAHGDFDQAGIGDRADQGEDFGARRAAPGIGANISGPDGGEPFGAPLHDHRDIGPGFDIVQHGGFVPVPELHVVYVFGSRFSHSAGHRRHQRSGFTADKRSGSPMDVDIEIESGSEDVVAQQPVTPGVVDGFVEPDECQGIFLPDIDEPFVAPNSKCADDHPLQNRVGIGFDDAPVHKCTGISFIGVADHVTDFLPALRSGSGGLPFHTGGESAASATAYSGSDDLADHILGWHRCQDGPERLISIPGDIVIDVFRIDQSFIPQSDQLLFAEKADLIHRGIDSAGDGIPIHQTFHGISADQMAVDDLRDVGFADLLIENAIGLRDHDRTFGAESIAAGAHNQNLRIQSPIADGGGKGIPHIESSGGDAAGAGADHHHGFEVFQILSGLCCELLQIIH